MKIAILGLLAILAFLGGAVGGEMLRKGAAHETAGGQTAPAEAEAAEAAVASDDHAETEGHGGGDAANGQQGAAGEDWFRFPNQFFVPVMRNGATNAVMVLSLTIEMSSDAAPLIARQEHRLRDALLNALMIEANTGGFDGNFTSEASLSRLRRSLLAAARKASGPGVTSVLIEDIARQDQ